MKLLRNPLVPWAILATIVTLWGIDAARRPERREELERLEASESSLKAKLAARDVEIGTLRDRVARVDSAARADSIAAAARVDSVQAEAAADVRRYRDRIEELEDPVALEAFDRAIEAKDREIESWKNRWVSANTARLKMVGARDSLTHELTDKDRENAELHATLERERDLWKKEARPSLGVRVLRALPKVAAGAAGAYLADHLAPDSELAPPLGAAIGVLIEETRK